MNGIVGMNLDAEDVWTDVKANVNEELVKVMEGFPLKVTKGPGWSLKNYTVESDTPDEGLEKLAEVLNALNTDEVTGSLANAIQLKGEFEVEGKKEPQVKYTTTSMLGIRD